MFELLVSLLIAATTPYLPVTAFSADPNPDEEVERAARDFRIQVYNTFHRDRSQYDSRSEAGGRVLSGYLRSGRRPEHREIVKDWLAAARNASRPEQVYPLPDLPDFAAELPAEPVAATAAVGNAPIGGSQPARGASPSSSTHVTAAKGGSNQTSIAGKVGGALVRAAMKTPRFSVPEPSHEQQTDIELSVADSDELATVEHSGPMLADMRGTPSIVPEAPGASVAPPAEEPATSEPAPDPIPGQPENEEAASPAVAVEAPTQPSGGPIQPVADENVPVRPSAASQRLATKITGFNGAIDYLFEETKEESPAKLFDIARLLNDLVDLAQQRQEIVSQLETLPQADRDALPRLLPIEPATTAFRAMIDNTRSELDAGESFNSDEERQRALELLNVLESQLGALSAGE